MREKAAAKTNPASRLKGAVWDVVEVRALPAYRLFVRFADGTQGEVDTAPMLFGPSAGVFERLRDEREFSQAFVDEGAVAWPSGLDLAPDTMHDRIKAHGRYVMSP